MGKKLSSVQVNCILQHWDLAEMLDLLWCQNTDNFSVRKIIATFLCHKHHLFVFCCDKFYNCSVMRNEKSYEAHENGTLNHVWDILNRRSLFDRLSVNLTSIITWDCLLLPNSVSMFDTSGTNHSTVILDCFCHTGQTTVLSLYGFFPYTSWSIIHNYLMFFIWLYSLQFCMQHWPWCSVTAVINLFFQS